MDTFVSRLKQLAATCDYGDFKDDFLRDEVIDKCHSNRCANGFCGRETSLSWLYWI
jgi:hypothetical protein